MKFGFWLSTTLCIYYHNFLQVAVFSAMVLVFVSHTVAALDGRHYNSDHEAHVADDDVDGSHLPYDHESFSMADSVAGRFFQVQNVSLVITYTGLIVAIVMMSSLLCAVMMRPLRVPIVLMV